jgi:glycosyltransferase involved in cell wall biosynthesis
MRALLWDRTKTGEKNYPASGMKQVAHRLFIELQALGIEIIPVRWNKRQRQFISNGHNQAILEAEAFVTPEVFSENERPGFLEWAQRFPGRKTAIFYDAIPLRNPHITWPQSVARHPLYMEMLGIHFDQILSISEASNNDLHGYWKWLGLKKCPQTATLQLGADLYHQQRGTSDLPIDAPMQILIVGILEPRKNLLATIDSCKALWKKGIDFTLHLAGRVNPHYGKPILTRIKKEEEKGHPLVWHESPKINSLLKLYREAHMTIFPSIAEGCGLPVLESLWMGKPVLASNLPCISENSSYGGVAQFDVADPESLTNQLQKILKHPQELRLLTEQASEAQLPTWKETASALMQHLTLM